MKMIISIFVLLSLLISCSKKESTEPTPTTGIISGTVMNKAGDAAVPSAIITTEPPTSSVSSAANGKYAIEEVDSGNYIVQAVKDGYDPGNVNVTVKAGKTVTADIRMGILLANHPPTEPQLISPENSSEYQSTYPTLKWKESSDQDGDAIAYDLYFGKENPPPLNLEDIDSTSVKKSNLDIATVYYWQVVAKDSKGAKTAGDVWQFKTTPNPIPTKGLVAYWPFNGNAKDESGNGNDGTVHGATLTTDRFGNENSAYYFDGVDDYIEISKSFSEISKQITFSLWIYTKEFPNGYAEPLRKENSFQVSFLGKDIYSLGLNVELGIKTRPERAYWQRLFIPFSQITLNSWVHLALTANGTELKIYLNGKQYSNTLKYSGDIYNTSSNNLFIGAYGTSNEFVKSRYFHGNIDDIAIYKRALSANEIYRLYQIGGWDK